jgi:hypothetical protein
LADLIIKENTLFTSPLWGFGIGIVYDCDLFDLNKTNFNLFKDYFLENDYILIRNWKDKNIFSTNKKRNNDFDSFLETLKINGIKYILEYSNTFDKDDKRDIPSFKLRNGEKISYRNKYFIDFFNEKGRLYIQDNYKNIYLLNASGLYFEPFVESNFSEITSDPEIYNNIIVKNEKKYSILKENIGEGLFYINNEIKKTLSSIPADFCFFSNTFHENLNMQIFLKNQTSDPLFLKTIEPLILKVKNNIGFILTKEIIKNIKINKFIKLLFPMLFSKIFFLENNVLLHFKKNKILNSIYSKFKNLRNSLKMFIDYVPQNSTFYSTLMINNSIKGCLINENLYFGFISKILFEKIIYLPESNWYCINSGKITFGNTHFSYRGEESHILLFQKENSIIPFIPEYQNPDFPQHINFSIYLNDNFSFEIIERIKFKNKYQNISHKIDVIKKENSFQINYMSQEKDNTGRIFTFHFITQNKIIKIKNNEKTIIFPDTKKDCIEFDLINKTNNLSLEILFEITSERS